MKKLTTFLLALLVVSTGFAQGLSPSFSGGAGRLNLTSGAETSTSGVGFVNNINCSVAPTASSTRKVFCRRSTLNFTGANNIATGGYISADQSYINYTGAGTADKLVLNSAQLDAQGGNILVGIGFEPSLAVIGSSTTVSDWIDFFSPNLSGVANIGRVTRMYAFMNQDVNKHIKNWGRYLDTDTRELAPAYTAGTKAGRFYSAPHTAYSAAAINANIAYFVPVHVPLRTTITKLGLNVNVAAASSACRIGLYKPVGDTTGFLLVAGGSTALSTTTTGDKEDTVSYAANAGMYWLAMVCNGTPTLALHNIGPERAAVTGSSASTTLPEATYIGYAYAALPSVIDISTTPLLYNPVAVEPHLWWRP